MDGDQLTLGRTEFAIPDIPLNSSQIKVIEELTEEYSQKGVELVITVVK